LIAVNAVLTLPGCAATSLSIADVQLVGAVAVEAAAAAKCPRTKLERAVLLASRAAFDDLVAGRLGPAHQLRLERARAATDKLCNARSDNPVSVPVSAGEAHFMLGADGSRKRN